MSDTNLCDELISLTDLDFWPDFAFTKEAMCEQFYFRSNQGGLHGLFFILNLLLNRSFAPDLGCELFRRENRGEMRHDAYSGTYKNRCGSKEIPICDIQPGT